MANDHSQIHSEGETANMKDMPSSSINDAEALAWERSLYGISREQQREERQRIREDLDLLWHSVPKTTDLLPRYDSFAESLIKPDASPGYDPVSAPSENLSEKPAESNAARNLAGAGRRSGSSSQRTSGKRRSSMDTAWDTITGADSGDTPPAGSYSRSGKSKSRNKTGSVYSSAGNRSGSESSASAARKSRSSSGKKSRPKILTALILLFYIASVLIYFLDSHGYISKENLWPNQHTDGGGTETDDGKDETFSGGNDVSGDYTNPYPDGTVLTDFGYDYSDFYTSKYICSYEDADAGGHKYQELCVIDNNELVGTASSPKNTDRRYSNYADSMKYTLQYYLSRSYLPCGFTLQYVDSAPSFNFYSAGSLNPPRTADKDDYFETIIRVLSDSKNENLKDLDYKKISTCSIGEHNITYLEVTYEDIGGNKILDVISFEQKPLNCAFIAEYRCVQDDFDSAEEALEYLYGMLGFHTENFENVDASRHRFTSARVYNSHNTNSAKIDVSDLNDMLESEIVYKNTVWFTFDSYNKYGDPSLRVSLDYIAYNVIEDHGSFENWIAKTLENASSFDNTSNVQETDRKEFSFYAKKAYYLCYTGTEEIVKTTENVRYHKFLIETNEGGTLALNVKFVHDIPEDFDPQEFLSGHLELKFAK